VRDDTRLSRARARENEERPLLVENGGRLLGVQSGEGGGFGQSSTRP
jgi:hypothetical protein